MTADLPVRHSSGTSGRLVACGAWSMEVRDLRGPDPQGWLADALAAAAAAGALDLRCAEPLPGGAPLTPAEHVLPVPASLLDAEATRALGRRVAAVLRAGDLLVLSGPLGAGKTTFTQGLGDALGVRGRVTSPTFVLARQHRGPLPLMHVDAYRLRDAPEHSLDDLDLDGWLERGVVVVEWGEGVVEQVSADRLHVELGRDGDEPLTGRRAAVRPAGARWAVL